MQRRQLVRTAILAGAFGLGHGSGRVSGAPSTPSATPDAGATSLLLVRWELEAFTGADGATRPAPVPRTHTVQFLYDGRVLVRADCNTGSGDFALDGDSIAIHRLTTTLVACPNEAFTSAYTAALSHVKRFAIVTEASDRLTLTTADGVSLAFAPSLPGVVWEFLRFRSGKGDETTVDDPSRYTLEIHDDDTAEIVADCNRGTGTASIDGDSIDIQVSLTELACSGGSLGAEYAGYLAEAVSWVIRDGELHLSLPMDAGIASFRPRVGEIEGPATPGA